VAQFPIPTNAGRLPRYNAGRLPRYKVGSTLASFLWQISSFGVDVEGKVYLIDLKGSIQRLDPAP